MAVVETNTGHIIGGVSLESFRSGKAEIGYFLAKAYQGLGIGSWAAHHLVSHAIAHHGLTALWTTAHPNKKSSVAILRKTLGLSVSHFEKASKKYCERDGTAAPRLHFYGEKPAIEKALNQWNEKPLRPVLTPQRYFLLPTRPIKRPALI